MPTAIDNLYESSLTLRLRFHQDADVGSNFCHRVARAKRSQRWNVGDDLRLLFQMQGQGGALPCQKERLRPIIVGDDLVAAKFRADLNPCG